MKIAIDLDGTLITCKEKQIFLLLVIAKAHGLNVCTEELWKLKRDGQSNFQALKNLYGDHKYINQIVNSWNKNIEDLNNLYFDVLFQDSKKCLQDLIDAGHELYLISARNNYKNAFYQLKYLNIIKFFKEISFISIKNGENKADKMRLYNTAYYIGDTEYDYLQSIEANNIPLILNRGQRSNKFLLDNFNINSYDSLESCCQFLLTK